MDGSPASRAKARTAPVSTRGRGRSALEKPSGHPPTPPRASFKPSPGFSGAPPCGPLRPMHTFPSPARRRPKTLTPPILLTPILAPSAPRIHNNPKTRGPDTSNARQKRGISYTPHQGWFSYPSRGTATFMVRSRYFTLVQNRPFRDPAAPPPRSSRSAGSGAMTATPPLHKKIFRTPNPSTRKTVLRFCLQKARNPPEMSAKVAGRSTQVPPNHLG